MRPVTARSSAVILAVVLGSCRFSCAAARMAALDDQATDADTAVASSPATPPASASLRMQQLYDAQHRAWVERGWLSGSPVLPDTAEGRRVARQQEASAQNAHAPGVLVAKLGSPLQKAQPGTNRVAQLDSKPGEGARPSLVGKPAR